MSLQMTDQCSTHILLHLFTESQAKDSFYIVQNYLR